MGFLVKATISRGFSLQLRTPMADPRAKNFSISCSFWEILTKSYVDAPPPPEGRRPLLQGILHPPLNTTLTANTRKHLVRNLVYSYLSRHLTKRNKLTQRENNNIPSSHNQKNQLVCPFLQLCYWQFVKRRKCVNLTLPINIAKKWYFDMVSIH